MKIEKVEKLAANLQDKAECYSHKKFKANIKSWISFKKVHKGIRLNQNAWLKPCIDMNTNLSKEANNDFEKGLFMTMNNAVFGKTMGNVRKHRDIKLVTTKRRRNFLVSEAHYHTTKFFRENIFAIEMKKTEIHMNEPV